MFSGIRLGELCRLKVNDLDLKNRELLIRLGKPKRDRLAFIDTSTQQWLASYLVQSRPQLACKNVDALFVTDKGKAMQEARMQDIVTSYVKRVRIRKHITPHSFRRTLCTLLLRAGLNIKVISDIVGHEALSTTAKYTAIDIQHLTQIYRQGHPFA